MITDILYRCPSCGRFDWLEDSKCRFCSVPVQMISRSEISIGGLRNSISFWYGHVLSFDPEADEEGLLLRNSGVVLSREAVGGTYKGLAGICAKRFTRAAFDTGTLLLKPDALLFNGKMESLSLPVADVIGLTIESDTIIVTGRERGVLFFDFSDGSGKKWEDTLRKVLDSFHSPRVIREYYPRLLFEDSIRETPARAAGHMTLKVPVRKWYNPDTSPIFSAVRTIAKPVIRSLFSVDIKGIENIPEKGAGVLLSNHTSFLDSIILGVFPKRHIWFMAKNSEYKGPVLTWALKRARAFPVRRYANDVQAVRNALRIIQEGHILGIYPEGERTWVNTLLPFRNGTLRLVLALGRPVIPVGISGAYELMPRWTSSIEKSPVKIRIGEPFMPDHIPIPHQTRSDITRLRHDLTTRILALSGAAS